MSTFAVGGVRVPAPVGPASAWPAPSSDPGAGEVPAWLDAPTAGSERPETGSPNEEAGLWATVSLPEGGDRRPEWADDPWHPGVPTRADLVWDGVIDGDDVDALEDAGSFDDDDLDRWAVTGGGPFSFDNGVPECGDGRGGPTEAVVPWWAVEPAPAQTDPVGGASPAARDRPGRRRPGRPQVLMWTCPKGGSGKTSLSLRYAAFLASVVEQRSMRVVWLDGNLQQADGARYLGADERASRTIADLAGGPEPDEREVLATLTPPAETGRPVWALFGPALKAEADPRVVSPALYRRVLDVLRRHFDHVVVDTPVAEHHNAFFTDFVLPGADQLVVVVPPLLPVVRAVREWLELQSRPVAAGGTAFPAAAVRIVLNMSSPRSGCPVEAVRDAWLSRWTWAGEIPLDPGWTEATNNGTLVSGTSQLAAGFAELVRSTTGDAPPGRAVPAAWGGRLRRLWRALR